MSRAYCLTCNEQVHETAGGTCPQGHPVAADGYGPEPWVGFAGDTETGLAEVHMQHLDASGRPREHAGVGQHANGTPRANGSANGSSNGHAGSLTSGSVPFAPVDDAGTDDRPPSADLASDDLTALLADALRESTPSEPPPAPVEEPRTHVDDPAPAAPAIPVADDDADWGELANLAAELHLDEHAGADDGPGAPAPSAPEPHAAEPVDAAPEGELSASSIDDLLAELTSGTADPAPSVPDAPAPTPPPAPPAPPVAPTPVTPPPPPPPAPTVDETLPWDAPTPVEGVGSAPAADPADIWAETEPAPAEESAPGPPVDLSNFTARGKRVGDAGSARPARKKRGRKR